MNGPKIRSAYLRNNYAGLFQACISLTKPGTCVEIGILDGYSTIAIGSTLKNLGKGHLYAYDLFEDYPYTNQKYQEVLSRMERFDLTDTVTLRKKDILKAASDFGHSSIDFMHVDIANSGDTVAKVLMEWNEKINPGGILIFEGGSPLRDEISWMKKFDKEKILPELKANEILNTQYTYAILHPFPSVCLCSKNLDNKKNNWFELDYEYAEKENFKRKVGENELFDMD